MTQNLNKNAFSYKTAGAEQALYDLGLEKTALIEKLVTAPLKLLGRAGAGALGLTGEAVGHGVMKAGKGAWETGGKAFDWMGKGIDRFGSNLVGAAEKAGLPQSVARRTRMLGKGMGREMATFGTLSGGIEAAMADPGERLKAFGRGALTGAVGGAAWGAGQNLARRGLQKGLGAFGDRKLYGRLATMAGPKTPFSIPEGVGKLKGWGSKALIGGVPMAGGLAASYLPHSVMSSPQQQQRPFYRQPHTYYPLMAMAGKRGFMPQQQMPYGYGRYPDQ